MSEIVLAVIHCLLATSLSLTLMLTSSACKSDEPPLQLIIPSNLISEMIDPVIPNSIYFNESVDARRTASGNLVPNLDVEITRLSLDPMEIDIGFKGDATIKEGAISGRVVHLSLAASYHVDGKLQLKLTDQCLKLSNASVRLRTNYLNSRLRRGLGHDVSPIIQRNVDIEKIERDIEATVLREGNLRARSVDTTGFRRLSTSLGDAVQAEVCNGHIFIWMNSGSSIANDRSWMFNYRRGSNREVTVKVLESEAGYLVSGLVNTHSLALMGIPVPEALHRVSSNFVYYTTHPDGMNFLKATFKVLDKNGVQRTGVIFDNLKQNTAELRTIQVSFLPDLANPRQTELLTYVEKFNDVASRPVNRGVFDGISVDRVRVCDTGNQRWMVMELDTRLFRAYALQSLENLKN
jgi:hypothetical protein